MARLDEICVINMGQSPDSLTYNEEGNGLPFFQGNADFGEIYPMVRMWCSEPTKIAQEKDILISVRAPIGALNIANCECCIGRGLAGLTVNEDICVQDYLWYALSSKVDELNSKGTGSTFKAINKKILAETEIPLLPLAEQRKIAAVLDKVSDLIAKRRQQLDKLDELVKARFVELLGLEKAAQNAEPLENFLENITYGFTNPMPDAEEGPWKITAKDIIDGKINFLTARKTTTEAFDALTEKSRPIIGDVLLTKDGTLGRMAIVEDTNICVNQSVAVLRCNKRVVPKILMYLLQMPEYQRDMISNAGGGTIKHIYITKVNKMQVAVPSMETQKKLLAFLGKIEKIKTTISHSLEQLETLKKALMQEYFG